MSRNIKINTDYLKRSILPSITNTTNYLTKATEISKSLVFPENFIYKKELKELNIRLEKYRSITNDYKNMVQKNINDFDQCTNELIDLVKEITNIVVTKN